MTKLAAIRVRALTSLLVALVLALAGASMATADESDETEAVIAFGLRF